IGVETTNPAATSIWARAHLRDLEDRYTVGGPADLEQRIIDTSLRFGVLCRFTAFVAVDSRVVTDGTSPHQAVQPVETPQGWDQAQAASLPFDVLELEADMCRGIVTAEPQMPGYAAPPGAPATPGGDMELDTRQS